jgi:hypothetical protein
MRRRLDLTLVCGALSMLVACSKGGTTAAAQSSESKAATAPPSIGSACNRKLLTIADVAGILREPITGSEEIAGDNASTCKFTTASFPSISVTLRPGVGKASLAVWKSGRMPTASTPLTGIGDEAVWVTDLNEVISEQNNLLCDILAEGIAKDLAGSVALEQQRIGALCNKIFAVVK